MSTKKKSTKKELTKENEKLKARLADGDKVDEWLEVIASHIQHAQELNAKIDELEGFMPDGYEFYIEQGLSMNDIIEKITKENEKLKNDLRLCAKGLIPKDLIQRGIVEELKKENEKLKDEIKGLREKLDIGTEQRFEEIEKINEKYQKLKEENEKLKDENELKKDAWCPELILKDLYENTNYKDPSITIKEYIQKIEAENEDLKSQIPDKKGKKLSQKDKEILQDVWRDVAAIYAPATPEGTEEYEELHHKLKLIHRLMK